jgi:TctA family transporter
MLEAAISAIENMFSCPCIGAIIPIRFLFLFFGVIMGLALGAIPGLGGLVGLAVILPFTHTMDPLAAMAIMIGLIAVTTTSDTIPSVLFAVPGTTGSQATILDGHPMARKGEAGRAFGAAYMSSMLGGVFGALVLAVSIPILRPLVLILGSPEFFMMGILGISMVAVLSGRNPVRGLIAGTLGLMVGMIGVDPQTGGMRWVFGFLYLWDGIPLVPVTLGLFAIPEIVDLVIKGTSIADVPREKMKGALVGIRDTFQNWFLVLRCSLIGVWVGFIPGLGTSVVDWFAYGHAVQTEKGARESFGHGDVRGVIAPESANNAKEGGALIPTIAFGIPGSASMALFIAALMIHGISPGPDMIAKQLDLTYTMIWSLALANIMGTGICLGLTPLLAAVARARIHIIAPLVIIVVFLAAFQASGSTGDLIALLSFSVFGWLMKRFGWPRPPLVLGLVLSKIIENYLFISIGAYGFAWTYRPIVLLIAGLTIFSVIFGVRQTKQAGTGIPLAAGGSNKNEEN